MPERASPNVQSQAPASMPTQSVASAPKTVVDAAALAALTPRTLFTNLFRVSLPSGALGSILAAADAHKEEFEGRKRPKFYQAGDTLYCYGLGQEEVADRRFSPAIVTATTDKNFTKFLLARGLMELFRARDFKLRGNAQGFEVQDHTEIIRSSAKGKLHIIPQYNFQPYWVECTEGEVRFAFSVEPSTTTLPSFHIHHGLRSFEGDLENIAVVLNRDGCRPGCPLYGRKGEVLGRFRGFAEPLETLDCTCHADSFDPVAIRVVNRGRKPGAPKRRRGGHRRSTGDDTETTLVIPGQLVVADSSQRQLLRLTRDRADLEHAGKEWLGLVSRDKKLRANALQVRYQRIQDFLARFAGSPTGPLAFSLPTGAKAELQRIPLTVEELSDIGGDDRDCSPYLDAH